MLFLRKESKITDTRFSEKNYCHTELPVGLDTFPENLYKFQSLADVEKFWTDLQFICLNTPLGRLLKKNQIPLVYLLIDFRYFFYRWLCVLVVFIMLRENDN